jgi:hypothetical protein
VGHSELLAFLLDPTENHGLGDSFLRRFLQRALAGGPSGAPISPVDLDVLELDDVEVRRRSTRPTAATESGEGKGTTLPRP